MIHHSDHGGEYSSHDLARQLAAIGAVPSMGSVRDCYDNSRLGAYAQCSPQWVATTYSVTNHTPSFSQTEAVSVKCQLSPPSGRVRTGRLPAIFLATVAAVAAVWTTSDVAVASQPAAVRALVDPTPEEALLFENELAVRKQFGLSTDIEVVKLAAASGTLSTMRLEIPLLPTEESELDRRVETNKAVQALVGTVIDRNRYSGQWIDPQAGSVVVALTDPVACKSFPKNEPVECDTYIPLEIRRAVAQATPVTVVLKTRTLDDLLAEFDAAPVSAESSVILDVFNNGVRKVSAGSVDYSSVQPDYRTRARASPSAGSASE